MALGKEQQPISLTPEERALQEVQGYIEQVEKKPEVPTDISGVLQQMPNQQPPLEKPIVNQVGEVVMQNAQPPIILPVDQVEFEKGLHAKLIDSLRWASEQCVMLIRKYPGRVFFSPPTES